jgi:hypothetical protein
MNFGCPATIEEDRLLRELNDFASTVCWGNARLTEVHSTVDSNNQLLISQAKGQDCPGDNINIVLARAFAGSENQNKTDRHEPFTVHFFVSADGTQFQIKDSHYTSKDGICLIQDTEKFLPGITSLRQGDTICGHELEKGSLDGR